jgi:hypothetical protein
MIKDETLKSNSEHLFSSNLERDMQKRHMVGTSKYCQISPKLSNNVNRLAFL